MLTFVKTICVIILRIKIFNQLSNLYRVPDKDEVVSSNLNRPTKRESP